MFEKQDKAVLGKFLIYRQELAESLDARNEVVGLVFVGSAADTSRVDEWSDHDFFVITKDGTAESLRQDLSWLPNFQDIAIQTRETAHGLKVVYRDGHVLEFAVFNDPELELAGANDFAVFIDKANIQARMEAIAAKSAPKPFQLDSEFELFLAHLVIGVGRFRRGETLIAGQQIRSYALNHVLGMVRFWKNPVAGSEKYQDNLNRYRRFEIQYPEEAALIEELLQSDVENCSIGLLKLILNLAGNSLEQTALEQVTVVKQRLGWA